MVPKRGPGIGKRGLVEASRWMNYPIGKLRHILYGASPISEMLFRQAMEVYPNARVNQAYGQTCV